MTDQERLLPGREEVSSDGPHEDDVNGSGSDDLLGYAAERLGASFGEVGVDANSEAVGVGVGLMIAMG
jgi:hypothetical protein